MEKDKRERIKYGYFELRQKYRKYFAIAFTLAILFHGVVLLIYFLVREEPQPEVRVRLITEIPPPAVKFIQRAPRLAKEIDVGKEPEYVAAFRPRDFKFERVEAKVEAPPPSGEVKASRSGTGSIFYGALTSGEGVGAAGWGIPAGATSFGRSLGVGGSGGWYGSTTDFGPNIASDVVNTRASGTRAGDLTRMKDDLIDYSNYADRFEGMVYQDPRNKKKVQGFFNFYQLQWRAERPEANGEPGWNAVPQALQILVQYARDSTDVNIQLMGSIRLDSRELMNCPMMYMMGNSAAVSYTKQEAQNLGRYLRAGGFLWIDDGFVAEEGAFNRSARQLVADALGWDGVFERIPNTHRLYHAWEDFNGPPPGDETRPNSQRTANVRLNYLEGIFLGGRLAVLLSTKGYCQAWGAWRFNPMSQGGPIDNSRQLQFGINVIVFALTQPGGIVEKNKQRLSSQP